MCGRFSLGAGADELSRVYRALADDIDGWQPRYSIAPSTMIPVLRMRPGSPEDEGEAPHPAGRSFEPARWGFQPSWATADGPRPINARLETVATNGMFRSAFAAHRAVVPMSGYFEWTSQGGRKVPHFIHGDGLLSAASLVAPRQLPDGSWEVSAAIITTRSVDAAGQVHDRMPVFLADADLDEWLDPGKLDRTGAAGLVAHVAEASTAIAATLRAHVVDRRVNTVRGLDPTDPSLIAPVTSEPTGTA